MSLARSFALVASVAFTLAAPAALAASPPLADASTLRTSVTSLPGPARVTEPQGRAEFVVRLTDPPLAAVAGGNAMHVGFALSPAQQKAYAQQLAAKQSALMHTIGSLGGTEVARLSRALNALIVEIDASRVDTLATLAGVSRVRRAVDFQLMLSDTVPYIGATAVQNLGVDGTGVRVAVLDTGMDYTHRNLGGPGTLAAYAAAYGTLPADPQNKSRDGLFPTAKVVDGFDFVGEAWPNGNRVSDPDPIDFQSHGTHVGDIVAGRSNDGLHKGVAPGASLVAIKVCSAVATACNGVATLLGIDFALDPNGDSDLSDAVDVMNLSLGLGYGQREDDVTEALAQAVRLGVVVVASAGNDGDRPFVAGSPSITPEVISVAQTTVPSESGIPLVINSPASIAGTYTNTATIDYAPVVGATTGDVAYVGRGCPADGATPADAYLANPAGKIALIDRGVCSVSLKIDRAAKAGALGVLIGLVAAGDAVSFSFGGGTDFVPTLVIIQGNSNLIKAALNSGPVNATISAANAISLVGGTVSSSSRGPSHSTDAIKPDIGAPGGSRSAVVGTGTGESAFSGTSGASPMVAGSAALLVQAFPNATPLEIKARLMNSAETNIFINKATQPGVLAPITRIGGGEVRVNRALALTAGAWDAVDPASVSLSFGYTAVTGSQMLRRKVVLRNYASVARTFTVTPSFRYANDAASGAVTLIAPPSVTVPANGSTIFTYSLGVNANLLPAWTLNGGSAGGTGALLQTVEFDGYLQMTSGADTVRLPWHLLPHKAANTRAGKTTVALNGAPSATVPVTNVGGAVSGRVDLFSLTGTSPRLPDADLPAPGDNFAVTDLRAVGTRLVGVGGGAFGVQFAINTYGIRAHPAYPAEFDVFVDFDNDGTYDYDIYTQENGGAFVSGQVVVSVQDLRTGAIVTNFFADASLQSGNIILTALLSDLKLTPDSKFTFAVAVFDNYFTGNLTDLIDDMTVTLSTPKYIGILSPASVAPNTTSTLTVLRNPPGDAASPSQTGLLLMYRDAKQGVEAGAITVTP